MTSTRAQVWPGAVEQAVIREPFSAKISCFTGKRQRITCSIRAVISRAGGISAATTNECPIAYIPSVSHHRRTLSWALDHVMAASMSEDDE